MVSIFLLLDEAVDGKQKLYTDIIRHSCPTTIVSLKMNVV